MFIWLIIGIISSMISHFIIEFLFYEYEYTLVLNRILETHTEVFSLGAAILFIFYVFLSSLFGNSFLGGGILIMLSWLIGIITQYKNLFRAEPLYPNEFYMIKELPFLLEMIGIKRTALIIFAILLTVGSLFVFYKYVLKSKKNYYFSKKKMGMRIIGIIISLVSIFYISKFNYPDNKVKEKYSEYVNWVYFDQNRNYDNNGFIAGFLLNLSAPPMNEHKDYSKISIENIVNKYKNIAREMNNNNNNNIDSNVIFVMNESFSDPFNLEGIESNKDPLPYYRELIESTLSGNILAPGFGGGTATNEFQVLTGFSMEPFDYVSSPYIQLSNELNNYPSVAKKFNDINYKTTAIHPYTPTFYRRNDAYNNLGFDEFRHQDNMKYTEKISSIHRYISDFAAYQEIFDVMEASSEPDFIHVVTMQNHTTYAEKYDYVDFEVEGSGNRSEANAYFKDLENSDVSLRLLINKIDSYKEPILLVFWGDHLPTFYNGDVLDRNESQTLYETPFFIYSNEIELEGKVDLVSPAFLGNYMTEILKQKINPYEAMLLELRKQLPVLDARLYIEEDAFENLYSRDELSIDTLKILEEYSLLMYDITTGNQYAHELGFFE